MTQLPNLAAPQRTTYRKSALVDAAIRLGHLDYTKARAIPGAIYSSEHKQVILPAVTPRAAIVALALFPQLGDDYPELIEARESLLQDVSPTDYATPLGLRVHAPDVEDSLLDDGHAWLDFGEGASQATDLGYAAAALNKYGAFYLGWARGYGKTLGTCALIEANDYERVLIVVPNTAKQDVWMRELQKRGTAYTHRIIVLPNEKRKREETLERVAEHEGPLVLVVHHEALALVAGTKKRASGRGKAILDGWKRLGTWDLMAIDEAHRLKSSGRNGSLFHRAALKVPNRHRLALSGSVYENNWEEIYGVLRWLLPSHYATKADWTGRYLDYVDGGYGRICVGVLPGREQAMRDELGAFLIVREKEPKAVELKVHVDLHPPQRKAYDELRETYATMLDDGTAVISQVGAPMLNRLRQLSSGLDTLGREVTDSSKLDAAMQVISDYEDFDDFFVATWYKATAYSLEQRLREHGYDWVFVITGNVPQKRRTEIIQRSRVEAGIDQPQPVILIGTIPTLGESANLQHLNHVIRIDRSFNPALNRQVVDRCDRTGQERTVRLTDIIAKDTVDEFVVAPNLANKDAFRALILGRPA